jgi:hypothetical protein
MQAASFRGWGIQGYVPRVTLLATTMGILKRIVISQTSNETTLVHNDTQGFPSDVRLLKAATMPNVSAQVRAIPMHIVSSFPVAGAA